MIGSISNSSILICNVGIGTAFQNTLLKKGMDGMGRRGTRREQLLDYLEETRRYWLLKRKHYIVLWRTRRGRGYGLVVRQTT